MFTQAPYSESLINLFKIVSTPYNTVIDEAYWDVHFQEEKIVQQNFIKPLKYDNEEDLHQKLQAITFPGQYGDKVTPIHCRVNTAFIGKYQFNGNESLEISETLATNLHLLSHGVETLLLMKIKSIKYGQNLKLKVKLRYSIRYV